MISVVGTDKQTDFVFRIADAYTHRSRKANPAERKYALHILAVIALLLPMSVWAGRLTEKQALQRARQFLTVNVDNADVLKNVPLRRAVKRGMQPQADTPPLKRVGRSAASHCGTDSVDADLLSEPYYVFNAPQQGFVIASAYDCAQPVLAYGTEGSLDMDNLPEQLQAWLDGYGEQTEWLEQHPEARAAAVTVVGDAIAPMLKSAWGQDEPYNLLCPISPSKNEHCPTGCVATVMAQVMYYHRWPQAVAADIPTYGTTGMSGMPFAAGTPIDWDDMLYTYPAIGPTDKEKEAVAQLMAMCGTALKTNYSAYSSSAGNISFKNALKDYFDYDPAINIVERINYRQAVWNQLIYDELKAGRVVPYFGGSLSTYSTHAFIIDGYGGDDYFHVDWGWSGGSNGYFLLSVMNYDYSYNVSRKAGPLGYSTGQTAVIGVQKNRGAVQQESELALITNVISLPGDKQVTRNSISDDFSFTVHSEIRNGHMIWNGDVGGFDIEGPFDYAIGVFTLNGDMVTVASATSVLELEQTSEQFTRQLAFGTGISSGTYIVKGISRLTGTGTWHANYGSDKYYVVATIDGNTMTLETMPFSNVGDFSGTFEILTAKPLVGKSCKLKCTLTNKGDSFNGTLGLFIDDEVESALLYDFESGETKELTFSFTPWQTGTKTITLGQSLSLNYNTYLYDYTPLASCQITVEEPKEGKLYILTEAVDAVDGIAASGDLKLNITLTNKLDIDYDNDIAIEVYYEEKGSRDLIFWQDYTIPVEVPALQTVNTEFTIKDLPDNEYWIQSFYKKDARTWARPTYMESWRDYMYVGWTIVNVKSTYETALELNLKEGWNWLSTNVADDYSLSATDFTASIGGNSVVSMQSQTQELYSDGGQGLAGDLHELAPGEAYKLQLRQDVNSVRQGTSLPATTLIELKKGWNWIGYVPTVPLPVNTALERGYNLFSDAFALKGERVVGREAFAEFDGEKWLPEDFIMKPGEGYLLYSKWNRSFLYSIDNGEGLDIQPSDEKPANKGLWHYNAYAYPDNMTMVCELDPQQTSASSQEPIIGAFVNGECRGEGRWVEGKLFLTVHGTIGKGENITLQAADMQAGVIYPVQETFDFDGSYLGPFSSPIVLHLAQEATSVITLRGGGNEQRIFDLSGRQRRQMEQGVNIVKTADGTVRKDTKKSVAAH